jgi:hypothetical protein
MKTMLRLAIGLSLAASSAAVGSELSAVPFTLGRQQFKSGDSIVIDQVQATSANPGVGDKMVVRGHYHLVSAARADLGLRVTHKTPAGWDDVARAQTMAIKGADGSFELACEITYAGNSHVSFYPADGGEAFGGVYFTAGAPKH